MADKSQGNAPGVGDAGAGGGGDDIAAIMAFDPFAPPKAGAEETPPPGEATPSGEATPAEKSKGATGTGKEPPAPKPGAAATPAPAAPAAPTPATPQAQPDLTRLFQEQTAAIKQLVADKAPEKAAEPAAPKYNVGIPPKLLDAMASEDPQERAVATHALVNGIANMVWNDVSAAINAELGKVMQGMPQLMEAHYSARQTQQQVFDDFYGAYAHLNRPELQPMVLSAAQLVFKEFTQAGKAIQWNAELRDAIANKIHSAVPALKPAAAPGGNGAQPAKPRFTPGGGARPSGAPAGPESDMLAVLGIRQ
jgi:hypothetical protein